VTKCGMCDEPGRLYLPGSRCPAHTPAALAGRTVPVPDPGRTLAAISTAPAPEPVKPARHFPDDEAIPCIRCGKPAAPILAAIVGVIHHPVCYATDLIPARLPSSRRAA